MKRSEAIQLDILVGLTSGSDRERILGDDDAAWVAAEGAKVFREHWWSALGVGRNQWIPRVFVGTARWC